MMPSKLISRSMSAPHRHEPVACLDFEQFGGLGIDRRPAVVVQPDIAVAGAEVLQMPRRQHHRLAVTVFADAGQRIFVRFPDGPDLVRLDRDGQIGRASGREIVCLYGWIWVVAVSLKKK